MTGRSLSSPVKDELGRVFGQRRAGTASGGHQAGGA